MDDGGSSLSSASYGSCSSSGNEEVVLRIHVPELSVERCLTFHSQDLVWTVKQAALTSLPKELRESFNYGLFCPPQNGRAGKFLDEERPLADYPLSSPMGYLELKYKRRVYKMLKLEEKTLRALHTRANLRRFLDWVKEGNVEKVAKMCGKGMDPNFHCQETGDTPLTIAARGSAKGRKGCAALLVSLVNGGALLDYRTRDGLTAMHRAVQADNLQGVRTLLDLGASPNYRDHRGLTPLYYCVTYAKDPLVCEALLHDYAVLGVADHQGWQETHQACRNKLVQHLEHLLFYGAELNSQNASGNTPLHVCAVNNLEDCARVLLFRGCDKNALNFANQNAYQVAIISGNLELAEVINNHLADEVVPFKTPPRYNPRRRVSGAPLLRATSDPRLENPCVHKPPSPAPSSRSIPPFSSASSLSETSTGSGSTNSSTQHSEGDDGQSHYDARPPSGTAVAEALSDTSSGICSSYQSSAEASHSSSLPPRPQYQAKVQEKVKEKDEGENEEDGSGSESSSSGGGSEESGNGRRGSTGATISGGGVGGNTYDVGALVVCVQQQLVKEEGRLLINPGDIVQVSGSTDDGLLEGVLRGATGTFPPSCVQSVRLRNPQAVRDTLIQPQVARALGRIVSLDDATPRGSGGNMATVTSHYGTAPRARKAQSVHAVNNRLNMERRVVLHRGKKGFGFVLRGAKARSPLMDRGNAERGGVALQYLDDVDPGGVADMAGLKPGDYLLKINGEDVSQASHEHVVNLIRKSNDLVEMTVVTSAGGDDGIMVGSFGLQKPPLLQGGHNSSVKRGCQTLPRKHNFSRSASQTSVPPIPPPRDPSTSLSVGRARARSVVAGIQHQTDAIESVYASGPQKLASIKARPASALRMTASQMEDLISKSSGGSLPSSPTNSTTTETRPPRVYASVAEMKKAKALRSRLPGEFRGLHKVFHSTPDLQNGFLSALFRRKTTSQEDLFCGAQNLPSSQNNTSSSAVLTQPNSRHSLAAAPSSRAESSGYSDPHYYAPYQEGYDVVTHGSLDHRRLRRSQSAINSSQLLRDDGSSPTATIGQVVKVDISRSKSEYASVAQTLVSPSVPENVPMSPGVMSSFRPSDCAKLYASPEQIKTVGYRNPALLAQLNNAKNGSNGTAKSRSQSLPPTSNRPAVQRSSPEKDTSMDSGIYSSTHSTFRGVEIDNENYPCDDDDLPLPPPPLEDELVTYARPQNNKSVVDPAKLMSTSYTMSKVHPSYVDNRQMSTSYTGPSSSSNPALPDPDYSSEEESTCNSQYEDNNKVQTVKKKKHSVAFAPSVVNKNEVNTKEPPHYAAPIVKETVTVSAAPVTPQSSPPRSKIENFSDLIAKKAAERRTRQENGGNVSAPSSATSSPSKRNTVGSAPPGGLSDAILGSALFNKQKDKVTNGNGNVSNATYSTPEPTKANLQVMKNSKSCPNEFSVEDGENSSSGVSSDHEVQHDSSYVTVINTESNIISESKGTSYLSKSNSIEDSSVSSESSEDASDRTWILTNERGDKTESSKDAGANAAKRMGPLTRNAVSMVKLPPPQEKKDIQQPNLYGETNNRSLSNIASVAERETHSLPFQQLPASHPLAKSHPLPAHLQGAIHPSNTHVGQAKFSTLQRPHSNSKRFTKAGSDPPSSRSTRTVTGGALIRSRSTTRDELSMNSESATLDRKSFHSSRSKSAAPKGAEYERSIDESLQLIRMHMNSLNEVNTLVGIPSSKHFKESIDDNHDLSCNANKSSGDNRSNEVLAPPPQFSDPTAQMKNNRDLLWSNTGPKRSKASILREVEEDSERAIRVYKRSNRRVEEEFISDDDRTFRTKCLDEWSTNDTTDWLESLFMPEYKHSFENKQMDGAKLLKINNESLINLGVRQVGHRVNMEKSLKRYRPLERIDL
uniref:SH3 and multiple ankyrin repeat domains protein 3 n=1 Tax=Hirondellea gigas TaxID=1518452 RepID=A0A6A7G4R8_9CRUS